MTTRTLVQCRAGPLWMLSDPLYLVEGNDRKTEQYARQVLIRIREGAVNGRAWIGKTTWRRSPSVGEHPRPGPGSETWTGDTLVVPAYGEPPPRSGVPASG